MIEYRNAVMIEDMLVDCEVNHPEFGWVPVTLGPKDDFDNGLFSIPELYTLITESGDYTCLSSDQKDDRRGAIIRSIRDGILITKVDPIVMNPLRYGSLTTEQANALLAYRQALLDIPDQIGFPHNVVWPTEPTLD